MKKTRLASTFTALVLTAPAQPSPVPRQQVTPDEDCLPYTTQTLRTNRMSTSSESEHGRGPDWNWVKEAACTMSQPVKTAKMTRS
jgi:hypothetical protein